MERAFSELTTNLERAQQALARERIARARGDADADDEGTTLSAHRWLLSREARDILGELADRPYLEPREVSALGYHLRTLARERALGDTRARLRRLPAAPIVVDENGIPLRQALAEIAAGGRPERIRALANGIDALAAKVGRSLAERLGESHDAAREYERFVDPLVDVDRPLPKLQERARELLDATDGLAEEALDFLRGRHGAEIRTVAPLHAALRRAELDDAVKPVSRARRTTELLRLASFGTRVEQKVAIDAPAPGLGLGVSLVLTNPREARLLPGADLRGIPAELAFVEATGRALAIVETHPGLPPHLARPRRGRLGRVVGSLLVRAAFDGRRLRSIDAPEVARERTRRVAATATILRLRFEASRALGLVADADLARATGVEWGPGLAAFAAVGRDPEVRFDALAGGLAWARALRELYDEEFLRHASTREWLGTVFARAGVEGPEKFDAELGLGEGAAKVAAELRGWFEGRV